MTNEELVEGIGTTALHLLGVWNSRVYVKGSRSRAWAFFTYSRAPIALREGLIALSET